MTNNGLITHSNIPCRAKDPATCNFHSAEKRMNDAVTYNDLEGYFRFRAQWEAAKMEAEVQEFLAAHEPIREIERHGVDSKDVLELLKYGGELLLDVKQPDGSWGYATFKRVDSVQLPNKNYQLIVRRTGDGKLFGIEHEGYGGYDMNGEEYNPFEGINPELVEVQAADTLKIVTVYSSASQPTVEELEL